tara:strand:- start:1819 stop:2118 length:300 start_codon:yes stop_codon:yes gene_type:complete
MEKEHSDKNYAVAVFLAAVFSLLGVHHFYVGRIGHGLIDIGITIVAVYLIISGSMSGIAIRVGLGALLIALDYVHTVYFTYRLITGTYRDGNGKIIQIG